MKIKSIVFAKIKIQKNTTSDALNCLSYTNLWLFSDQKMNRIIAFDA